MRAASLPGFPRGTDKIGIIIRCSLLALHKHACINLIPQHRGFDTSTLLHPHPINEGVKRGEGGGEAFFRGVKIP